MDKNNNFRKELEFYWKGSRRINKLATEYTRRIDKEKMRKDLQSARLKVHPCICFSRNIAASALDLALLVGEKLGCQVVDREIIDYIFFKTHLSRESIATFDERYPGLAKELMCLFLGERPFTMNSYAKDLFVVSYFLATTAPTVFVGRGIHLMLPRNQIIAVRCISNHKMRAKRFAKTRRVDQESAGQTLVEADREQAEFFQRVHGKKHAPPEEFDIVLNMDRIVELNWAAEAIVALFQKRF